MRLSCTNCGAEYEVPDDVIPQAGRDVQCSNCGHIWFQPSAGHAVETVDDQAATLSEEDFADDLAEPQPEIDLTEADASSHSDPDPIEQASPRPAVDESVASILREEAERETRLRAQDSESLAVQTDMGLDDLPPARSEHRRADAFEDTDPVATHLSDAQARKGVLPDIEEINSTLNRSDDDLSAAVDPSVGGTKRSGGFMRGFSIAMLLGAGLFLIYANAPRIAQSVPQADPTLSAYVALVDQARFWLDGTVADLMPKE